MTYATANSRYLENRVATASQPELQLILLDGALRFGRLSEQLWNESAQRDDCDHLLTRVIDILETLIQGVAGGQTELSKRFEEEYAFVFRQVSLAHLHHDSAPLALALRLLDFERETWRLACEQLKTAPEPGTPIAPLAGAHFSGASLSLQG